MKRYRKQVIIISFLVVIIGGSCLSESFVERLRAEEILALLASVDVGNAPPPALITELENFHSYRATKGSQGGRSYEQFVFQNRAFALFGLAPAKVLSVQIDFKDGIMVEKSAHFAEAPNRGAIVIEELNVDTSEINSGQVRPLGPRQVEERGNFTEPTYMLSVVDSVAVPKERRQMDWHLDISCMTRLGPCGDFRNVLHGAFE
jgi:hypothetical protein